MAFDPIQEDCLRLILEAMRRERIYPLDDATFIERGMKQFREDPSQLITCDRDRSFHLTARATEILDYHVPFFTDEVAIEREETRAENFLREAVDLDEGNWDARRMLAALEAQSNDAYVSYLLDNREAVERDVLAAVEGARDVYDREYASDLAYRPLLRWLAATASRAVIAGQYRLAYQTVEESLEVAPGDPADIRHTGMLALAKLEASARDIKQYRSRHAIAYQIAGPLRRRHHGAEKSPDAWTLLAQMCVAYRSFDYRGADRALHALMRAYPDAAQPLFYQAEFPDGIYARVNVNPGSQDELILAISEATPLLQEGIGTPDNACFSAWLAGHELVQRSLREHTPQTPGGVGRTSAGGDN
ncbi:hypothetical protein [Collinsella tanakaei]|uniref:hypothetical protein n=1 Tax=Collinsella tanakaei TaxID=626935 RepID=UPI0025A4B0FC|nr:hypothetical protein [Collinsella tanakaei]MDM8300160.1 hypothetical protein [Collinsella tanakaei]